MTAGATRLPLKGDHVKTAPSANPQRAQPAPTQRSIPARPGNKAAAQAGDSIKASVDAGTAQAAVLDPSSPAPREAEPPGQAHPVLLAPAACNKRGAIYRAGHRSTPPRQRAWANWCAPAAVINATHAPALICLEPKAPALKTAPAAAEQQQCPKPSQAPSPKPTPLATYITRDTNLL